MDGEPVSDSLCRTRDHIKGVPGTTVVAGLKGLGRTKTKDFEVARRSVRIPSVSNVQVLKSIGYVQISVSDDSNPHTLTELELCAD